MIPIDAPPAPSQEVYLQMCMKKAEVVYQVPTCILNAIHQVESGGSLDARLTSKNKNGTEDFTPMQINTGWVSYFTKHFGITASHLKADTCLAVQASAYVVRYEINRAGDFWTGVGRYHSQTPWRAIQYRNAVAAQAQRFGCVIR